MALSETTGQILPFTSNNTQLGALDLGSNSFHLLIAQQSQGRVQILDKYKEMVRLAEGLNSNNRLSKASIDRALTCLERLAQRLRTLEPDSVRVVGTNTLRKATNSKAFIEQAEKILGRKIEVISGREEARLIYLGVCHDLGGEETSRLVVDIGGGSTELILGRKSTPEALESLYMGCVSMSRTHFKDGKLTKSRMQAAINDALLELEPVTAPFLSAGWENTVGASGTVNAVMDVLREMDGAAHITPKGLSHLRNALIAAKTVDGIDLPGLAPERKPVFAGGVAILSALFQALKIKEMAAAQSALREGLIYDLLGRQQQDDTRNHTVASLMLRYGIDEAHARQVRETAISLLSQVAMDWQLTEPQHKHLIGWAADLHEIGMDVSHAGFHKHGGYLVENLDMPGFSRAEQAQLALLVRAHRRKLSPEILADANEALQCLIVLLRISALLHRNRSRESLPHVNATASGETLTLSLPTSWRDDHPLTAVDLENEREYLEPIGIDLVITSH